MDEHQDNRELMSPSVQQPESTPARPDLIMALPPELRILIYEFVLLPQRPGRFIWGRKSANPSLLSTSKQVRKEAAPTWYKTRVSITAPLIASSRFDSVILQCGAIVDLCGPAPFSELRIRFITHKSHIYENLKGLLPLLELMRAKKFELEKCFYQNRRYKYMVQVIGGTTIDGRLLRKVLGWAVKIGRKAREEEWTKELLEFRFGEFVDSVDLIRAGKFRTLKSDTWHKFLWHGKSLQCVFPGEDGGHGL